MEIRPILSALRRHRVATALIVLEVAFSCAILCNALFLVSQRLDGIRQPSGLIEDELVQIRLGGDGTQVDADARTGEDLAALRAVPGVASATMANQVPFHGSSSNIALSLTPDQENPTLGAAMYFAHPGLMDTFGLRLTAGRDFLPDEYQAGSNLFEREDLGGVRSAIIVSAATAGRLFPGENAVGRTVYLGTVPLTIVGVVDILARPDSREGNTIHSVILPIRLNYDNGGLYLLRVTDPARRDEVLELAMAALDRTDPNRLLLERRSYEDVRNHYFRNDRDMIGMLVTVAVALLLVTALGIVGLASFWVQQRTRQIGVRRALGATRSQIIRYFQTENFLIVGAGITLGMLLAYALNLGLMGQYELPRLPLAYLPAGALALWVLGQLAVLGPACRAADVPPSIATRSV